MQADDLLYLGLLFLKGAIWLAMGCFCFFFIATIGNSVLDDIGKSISAGWHGYWHKRAMQHGFLIQDDYPPTLNS